MHETAKNPYHGPSAAALHGCDDGPDYSKDDPKGDGKEENWKTRTFMSALFLIYRQPPQPPQPPHPDENHHPNEEPELNHDDELYELECHEYELDNLVTGLKFVIW